MFKWAQQQLANVAGTQEPIYGSSAIKSVAEEAKETPYSELTRDDLKWKGMESTCVETQTFYFTSDSGHFGMAQVIYSNVAGIRTTCQFNSKVFSLDGSKPHLWCSTALNNHDFTEDRTGFYADDCAIELSEDGTTYTIKSMNDERSIVNLTVKRIAPGFQVGKTGTTLFGTDLSDPWGSMRHVFWPRCAAEGTITTPDGPVDFKGKALFVHALQGMKPHHAAAKWNFVDFQGPTHSAVMMEYTTPASYGSTVVNVGGIAKDGEIVVAGSGSTATYVESKEDTESGWVEPTNVKWTWSGTGKDGKPVEALVEGSIEDRQDRVDVMAEVPAFVKKIIAGAAGTKPYIYQYMPQKSKLSLKLKIGGDEITEEGESYSEATFITE
ncbi:oxidative stress survival, Svf1-like protein [Phialemonium atrogriseum]|uniref:Oxidative stress survival, Svf1-like protein n=1 Tax=Phialemonium atrogriseum TaxID=1093897 RepID=A0AAJ0CBQ7_9PEZI|nr:oxidative stress survival, Svf1-like protein [Phialemonium atrogriseum]KAK1771321.1 oxidative stress survival, Svf1-like protein [Phialemonium atrogriseum]